MISAPLCDDEQERLQELCDYGILDTQEEKEFDDLTQLTSDLCGTPIALISLVDSERQWFKSKVGLSAEQTSRNIAFCAHAILQRELFEVEDTLDDPRFSDNPLVSGEPHIRFYAGAPLITPSGRALGTLCVIGYEPKRLSRKQKNALQTLSNEVVSRLELRKKLSELENAKELMSIFVSNVSHEIRTPMNGIMGIIKLLQQTELDPNQQQYVETLKRSSDGLLRIVNDVLDLSKIEADRLQIEHELFNLNQLLDDLFLCFKPLADEKSLSFYKRVPEYKQQLVGDGGRLTQILGNLVSNAIKFTSQGEIVLRCEPEDGTGDEIRLRFSIQDTGPGLNPEQQEKLFQRYQQFDSSFTPLRVGSGLGLNICKQLTELMGGEIGVNSRVGEGSEFWVELPYKLSEVKIRDVEQTAENESEAFLGTVLVVEDNRVNQIVARGILEKLGLTVHQAENGAIALSKMRETFYDLVLMDCHMPVMDGFETVHNIRNPKSSVQNPEVGIIAMTGDTQKSDEERCLNSGMNGFLTKPLDMKRLKQILAEWLPVAEIRTESAIASVEQLEPPINKLSLEGEADQLASFSHLPVFNRERVKALKLERKQLENVYAVFWLNAPKEINSIGKALTQNDYDTAFESAHSMKGSASLLGGDRLSALSEFIEQKAKAGEGLPARKMVSYLENCLDDFRGEVNGVK